MKKQLIRIITIIIFAFYCISLIYVLFLDMRPTHLNYFQYIKKSINIIPFKTISDYVLRLANNSINLSSFIKNICGNLILFLPLGFFLPIITKSNWKVKKIVTISFISIVSLELIQLLSTLGSFDIDDIILNLTGSIIGYCITKVYPISKIIKQVRELP